MTRDFVSSGLAVPLLVVAILAGILGFVVTRQVAPPSKPAAVRLSVVSLPATPTPTPSATPIPSANNGGGGSSGGGSGGGSNCPAGCQCSGQPGGIVIICH
jgi:hypothetical protein